MGRGSNHQASSAQGLLYGIRSRGSGPNTNYHFEQFVGQLSKGYLPSDIYRYHKKIKAVTEPIDHPWLEKAYQAEITGFNHPFGGQVARLILGTVNDSNYCLVAWDNDGFGTVAEQDLLASLANHLAGEEVTVLMQPSNEIQMRQIYYRYDRQTIDIVADPTDRQVSPSDELDRLAAGRIEEINFASDLIAASSFADLTKHGRNWSETLDDAFALQPFSFARPLGAWR